MKHHLTIVKIGGNILDAPDRLQQFLRMYATLGTHRILVHGGGKIATAIGERLGIQASYSQGRRITDAATLELVTMVYGGLINTQLVASLQATGCNAIGLTGADANIITASRRAAGTPDFGFVGDVRAGGVAVNALKALLDEGFSPVVAPLTHDGLGNLLNTNADTIAQELARALSQTWAVTLVYCFEKPGVLADAADAGSVIRRITQNEFEALVARGTVTDGMIPKLQSALDAIEAGVERVVIGQAESLPELINGTKGTQVQ